MSTQAWPLHSAYGVFQELGFKIYATEGTAKFYEKAGVKCEVVNKIAEGRPNVLDVILNKQVNLIINTPWARRDAVADDKCTRRMPRQKTCFLAWLSQAFGLCPCAIRKATINSTQGERRTKMLALCKLFLYDRTAVRTPKASNTRLRTSPPWPPLSTPSRALPPPRLARAK
ncbi:MGS-like domain-containing protein [Fibrobacter sp. UWH9]|nr:hypothetical protein [Fibrobacter sp. UWH9]SHG46624.1 MGS-like domain-containing protein [Fibrobacter sp. UWH9]